MLITGGTISKGTVGDLFGLGRVLDELEHRLAPDHRAGGDGEGLADLEGRRLHHGGDPRRGGHVPGQIGDAPEQAGAAGVDGGLPRHRAEDRVVAGGGGVDEVVSQETDTEVVAVVEVGVGHDRLDRLGGGEVGLEHAVQQGVVGPGRVGETAITFGRRHASRRRWRSWPYSRSKIGSPHGQLPGPPAEPAGQAEGLPAGPEAAELVERRPGQHEIQGAGGVRPVVVCLVVISDLGHVVLASSGATTRRRMIFPVGPLGRLSTSHTRRGYL